MPTPREWWQDVSSYLDEALRLSEHERDSWLAALADKDPALAGRLRELLEQYRAVAAQHFLEQPILSAAPVVPSPGQRLGGYTLVSLIGQGGMGTVWLAERSDGRFQRRAAIKFLKLSLTGLGQERFQREGRILGRLSHPHIPELLDAGVSTDGQPYFVLEHVEGEPIDRYCAQRALGLHGRIRLFEDLLGAVAYAHANLIVHRDIKPSNVLVRIDGQVKLLDFGIAKLLGDEAGNSATLLTREGAGPLTPEYAAPEQLTGGTVTTATDTYALGVLLFVLLTGQHPAANEQRSPADLIKAIVETDPQPPSHVAPALRGFLRGDLDTIVCKALKKEPSERYSTVTAFAGDLGRYLRHEPIAARPDAFSYRAAKFVRRNRGAVTAAAIAIAATLAGLVGTITQAHTSRLQRDLALRHLSRAEEINELNAFLLSDAAPLGRPFTVNQLLGQAEHIIARQGGNDAGRTDLLISIGRQYWTQDETNSAGRLLSEAYKISRGSSDPSTRAKASCALAANLARTGEPARAESLIEEGLRELPSEPQFLLDRVFCLLRGAEVARTDARGNQAVERTSRALEVLKQSPFPSEILELRAFMDLAESHRVAGRVRDAAMAFQQASYRLSALGRDETQTASTLYNNWALALGRLGRPKEAETLFRRALAISSSGGNQESVSSMLLINSARALRDIGRLHDAAEQAERGYTLAENEGDHVAVVQCLLLRQSIYRMLGDLRRADETLAEAETQWRRHPQGGNMPLAVIKSERALTWQAKGELASALVLANEAINLAESLAKEGRGGKEYIPLFQVRRADLELQLNRPGEAAADALRALKGWQDAAQLVAPSTYLGAAHLALGKALRALSKHREARAAFQSALEHFSGAAGPDHPDTHLARSLLESTIVDR